MAHLQPAAGDHRYAVTTAVTERELRVLVAVHAIEDVALNLRRSRDAVLRRLRSHAREGVGVETEGDDGAPGCRRVGHGRSVTRCITHEGDEGFTAGRQPRR
jgi:hypothetical protein